MDSVGEALPFVMNGSLHEILWSHSDHKEEVKDYFKSQDIVTFESVRVAGEFSLAWHSPGGWHHFLSGLGRSVKQAHSTMDAFILGNPLLLSAPRSARVYHLCFPA